MKMDTRFHPRLLDFTETESHPVLRHALKINGYSYWFQMREDVPFTWGIFLSGHLIYGFKMEMTMREFFDKWAYFKNTRLENGTHQDLRPLVAHIDGFWRKIKLAEITSD